MHIDHTPYLGVTPLSRLDKAINTLVGIVEGIAIDGRINPSEISHLNLWLEEHQIYQNKHPFNEIIPLIQDALSDSILTAEEREDILWLGEKLKSTEYYDTITADMQILQGLMSGIMADGVITAEELRGLSDWIGDHEHLKTIYPYDEVESLIVAVLADHIISSDEQKMLQAFFAEFTAILDNRTIVRPTILVEKTQQGLCAVDPEIVFMGSTFCLTGASYKYTRKQFSQIIADHGGTVLSGVSPNLNYLIIGAEGNPCWSYSCYGRKVEKAIELRKKGVKLQIIHERDFHDVIGG